MAGWEAIPFNAPVMTNVDETDVTQGDTACENGFITEAGNLSRFRGLRSFTGLPPGRIYLDYWRGDMIAVSSGGLVHRIDQNGVIENMTQAAVTGGKRPTFAHTDNELLIAAGGPIIRFNGAPTTILSNQAPISTHVGYVDGFVVALEERSGRFLFADGSTDGGTFTVWDPLNVFSASGKPEDILSLFVTPFNELLLCSDISSEQFEQQAQADLPFFRRWLAGEGIKAPGLITFEDNTAWLVNQKAEFIRLNGQIGQVASQPVQKTLENVDSWEDAWAVRVPIDGQRFILLQMPHATNAYGTPGMTMLFDVRTGRWGSLYGWDPTQSMQVRWPGWSYLNLWGRNFVGGDGEVMELVQGETQILGQPMPTLLRTGHLDAGGTPFRIDALQVRMKRGIGSPTGKAWLSIRANKDNRGFGRWKMAEVGRPGDFVMHKQLGSFGSCYSVQFELQLTDGVPLELVALEWQRTPLG